VTITKLTTLESLLSIFLISELSVALPISNTLFKSMCDKDSKIKVDNRTYGYILIKDKQKIQKNQLILPRK
jgi:hypothetical protein